MGAIFYGVLGGVTVSSLAADWVPGVRDVLAPAVLIVVLAFQVAPWRWRATLGSAAVNGDAAGMAALTI